MITRALVVDTDYASNRIKVRIPTLDGIADMPQGIKDADLRWASILCVPGIDVDYREGDVVVVGFENCNLSNPIILGYLKTGSEADGDSRIYGTFREMSVESKLVAPIDTTIGKTNYSTIHETIDTVQQDS